MTATELTAADTPPLPLETDLTRFFWDAVRAGRLAILRCQQCGHFVHYPRIVCNRCLAEDLAPEDVSGRGTLYSYTVVMQAFHPYFVERLPYTLAVVELEEEAGLRVTTNIIDCPEDQLRIDLPVEVAFVDVSPVLTLPMFRPRSR
jgi:uncharacterized OB-fold protein